MQRRIITRGEWGARYANGWGSRPLPVPRRFFHHSVTLAPDLVPPFDDDFRAIRAIEQIGQDRFGKGMSYTALFTPAGLIFEGLGIDRVGSHTADNNTAGAGLCLVGNYETNIPTKAQLDSVAWWLRFHRDHGYLTDATITAPHSAVYQTACPGQHARNAIGYVNATALGGENLDTINEGDDMSAEDYANAVRNVMITNPADGHEAPLWAWLVGNAAAIGRVEKLAASMPDNVWHALLNGDPLPDGSPFSEQAWRWLIGADRHGSVLENELLPEVQAEQAWQRGALLSIAKALNVTLPTPPDSRD